VVYVGRNSECDCSDDNFPGVPKIVFEHNKQCFSKMFKSKGKPKAESGKLTRSYFTSSSCTLYLYFFQATTSHIEECLCAKYSVCGVSASGIHCNTQVLNFNPHKNVVGRNFS
jgi:hypothetical protein